MNPLLMCWHIQKVAVNTFARFSIEISMVLESAGGCCESCNTAMSWFYLYNGRENRNYGGGCGCHGLVLSIKRPWESIFQ